MDAQPQAVPGFFASLALLARHDGLKVTIEDFERRLRVRVEVDGLRPLIVHGPAPALEARLPGEIEKYARWVDTNDGGLALKISSPADEPAPAAPRKPAPVRAKAAPKKRRAGKPASAPTRPRPAPAKKAQPKKKASKPAADNRPDKAACIADYKAQLAKYCKQLTRNHFVKVSKTGRRYEKLWGNNWSAFVKEATGGSAPAAKPAKPKAAAPKKAAPAKATPRKAAKASPPAKKKADPNAAWRVIKGGKEIAATLKAYAAGETYTHSTGAYVVERVDDEGREIYVKPAAAGIKPPGSTAPAKPPAEKPRAEGKPAVSQTTLDVGQPWPFPQDKAAAEAQASAPKRGVYSIRTAEDKHLGATAYPLKVGDLYRHSQAGAQIVTAVDDPKRVITVRPATEDEELAAAEKESP